jgi:hypothetical protein
MMHKIILYRQLYELFLNRYFKEGRIVSTRMHMTNNKGRIRLKRRDKINQVPFNIMESPIYSIKMDPFT